MQYKQLGSSDLKVSEIALGTMTFGEQNRPADAARQLDYAVARGVNFIDVAEMYPVPPRAETQGRTEEYVGRWLSRQSRDKLIVATKITGPSRGFDWIRGGPRITAATDQSRHRYQPAAPANRLHRPVSNPLAGPQRADVRPRATTTPRRARHHADRRGPTGCVRAI